MSKTIALVLAALALSVFVVACTTTPAATTGTDTSDVPATPEAQADAAASDAVIESDDDVEIGELV